MGASGLSSRAIIGRFYNRLEQGATPWVDGVSMYFSSDQESEEYKWLGMSPVMREWVGGRNAKGFRENGITVRNKLYEATMEVLVNELRRDKTGQVMVRVNETAERANTHWASLLTTLIINGESTVCYDGQYFFDTDHVDPNAPNQTAQSNDITFDISDSVDVDGGSATAPGARTMERAILKGVESILGFKDDQGEPMNENARNFLVMVPQTYMSATLAALSNTTLANGVTNTLVKQNLVTVTPVINPRLTWTTKFAVFRTDGQTKPFIRQEEYGVKVAAIAEGSELEFTERKHHYGIEASRNVAYGYWQHGCLVTIQA